MGGKRSNKDIARNRVTRRKGKKQARKGPGRPKGSTKPKRGRPKKILEAVVETPAESSVDTPSRSNSLLDDRDSTIQSEEIGYHEKALEFECGICFGKIKRERFDHKIGIFGYEVAVGFGVKVHSGKDQKTARLIKSVYGRDYPDSKYFNPNICCACIQSLNRGKLVIRGRSWDDILTDIEHIKRTTYDENFDCSTCSLAKELHPQFSKPLPQVAKSPEIKLCMKPLRDKQGRCLQKHGHAGNCSKRQSIEHFWDNIDMDPTYRDQILNEGLKRKQQSEGLKPGESSQLSNLQGPKQTIQIGKSREVSRDSISIDTFRECIAVARDRCLSWTGQRKYLADRRSAAKNDSKFITTTDYLQVLKNRYQDLHKVKYFWLGYKMGAVDDFQLTIPKYRVNQDCNFCNEEMSFDDQTLLHHTDNNGEPCKLLPDYSVRKRGQIMERLYAVGGTSTMQLINMVLNERKSELGRDIEDFGVVVRLNIDNGGKNPNLTKVSMSLVIPELGDQASNDSHKNCFVLASTTALEQFDTCEALWEMAQIESIFESRHMVRLTCDLKMINILFQLSGASQSKYPCIKCWWKNRLDANEVANGETKYDQAEPRGDYEEWVEFYEKVQSGEVAAGKSSGGVKGIPISKYLTDNRQVIVVTPELHCHEGILNVCIVPDIKKKFGNKAIKEWELEAGVSKGTYFDGKYNGNGCSKLAEKCEVIKKYSSAHYKLLKRYKDLMFHMFKKRDNLTVEHIQQARNALNRFIESWKEVKLNVTPKVHWVITHGMERLELEHRTLGFYAEQFAETLHQKFEKTTSSYNDSVIDPNTLLPTRRNRRIRELEAFNCLRHGIPKPKKTRAKRKLTGTLKQESSSESDGENDDGSSDEPTDKRSRPSLSND